MARTLRVSDNGAGHNSGGVIDGEALKNYVDRIARLMEEQKGLAEDIKEVAALCDEAGAASKKEVRRLARESLMDPEVLQSQLERMDSLRQALGSFAAEPLGAAALKEAAKPKRERKSPIDDNFDTTSPKEEKAAQRKSKTDDALDRAREHLGETGIEDFATGAAPAPFEEDPRDPPAAT